MAGASSGTSLNRGAYPAASSIAFRSRSGTSSAPATASTSSGLGRDRPVSTKLRWRVDTPTSSERSIWLRRRRTRQSLSSSPTAGRLTNLSCGRTTTP